MKNGLTLVPLLTLELKSFGYNNHCVSRSRGSRGGRGLAGCIGRRTNGQLGGCHYSSRVFISFILRFIYSSSCCCSSPEPCVAAAGAGSISPHLPCPCPCECECHCKPVGPGSASPRARRVNLIKSSMLVVVAYDAESSCLR